VAPLATSVTLVTPTVAAGTLRSVAKEALICAMVEAEEATLAAVSRLLPSVGAMLKAKASFWSALAQPCSLAGWPTAQSVQAEAPGAANVPSGHGAHERAPDVDAKAPAGHGWHVFELMAPAAAEKVPGEQSVQKVVPALSANEPGAQLVQFDAAPAPASADAVPAGQFVQVVELAVAKRPAAHCEHAAAPSAAL
jgi:hypothetical protein